MRKILGILQEFVKKSCQPIDKWEKRCYYVRERTVRKGSYDDVIREYIVCRNNHLSIS